jgi:hypothetical protein
MYMRDANPSDSRDYIKPSQALDLNLKTAHEAFGG